MNRSERNLMNLSDDRIWLDWVGPIGRTAFMEGFNSPDAAVDDYIENRFYLSLGEEDFPPPSWLRSTLLRYLTNEISNNENHEK